MKTPGIDLDKIRSEIGSVKGSMEAQETMSLGFKLRLDAVMFDAVPALLSEVDRLRKMEARVRRLALQLHDPSVIQHSFHIGSDPELDTQKVWIAARIRQALDG